MTASNYCGPIMNADGVCLAASACSSSSLSSVYETIQVSYHDSTGQCTAASPRCRAFVMGSSERGRKSGGSSIVGLVAAAAAAAAAIAAVVLVGQ